MVRHKGGEIAPEVVDACRRGDREAFRVLYETYKDRVYAIALYFFRGDTGMAADVTQQVFLRLMEKIHQFHGRSGFSTWLHRFVANACVDRTGSGWRRMTTTPPETLDEHPGPLSQEDDYAQAELRAGVQAALAELSPKIRMAILLRYFDDRSGGSSLMSTPRHLSATASRACRRPSVAITTSGCRTSPQAPRRAAWSR